MATPIKLSPKADRTPPAPTPPLVRHCLYSVVHTVRKVVWVLSLLAKSHNLENTSSTESLDKSLSLVQKIMPLMSVSLPVKESIVAPGWRIISSCTDGTLSEIADSSSE